MDKLRWINKGAQYTEIVISRAEKHYDAIYIADLSIIGKSGHWTEEPVSVFWKEFPDVSKGYKHYFGLLNHSEFGLMICDATSVTEGFWPGLESETGEIIFSRFQHDYRGCLTDKRIWMDGGREFTRHCGMGKSVNLKVIGPDFIVDDGISDSSDKS